MITIDIVFNFDQKKFLKGTLENQTCHFINGETLEITTTVPLNMLTARDPSLVDDGSVFPDSLSRAELQVWVMSRKYITARDVPSQGSLKGL